MKTTLLTYDYLEQDKQRRINQRAIQKKRLRLVWVNPNIQKRTEKVKSDENA